MGDSEVRCMYCGTAYPVVGAIAGCRGPTPTGLHNWTADKSKWPDDLAEAAKRAAAPEKLVAAVSQLGAVNAELDQIAPRRSAAPADPPGVREIAEKIAPALSSNPKHGVGSLKMALSLVPPVVKLYLSLALLDGKGKYGGSNWRATPVVASIYKEACERHLDAWWEGEEYAPDSKLPHLAHALACIAIIVDAFWEGTLIDDRPYSSGGYRKALAALTPLVKTVTDAHAGKNPKHWTIADRCSGEDRRAKEGDK